MTIEEIIKVIYNQKLGEINEDILLANLCSIKTGGTARALYMPDCKESLITVLNIFKENNIKYKIIGRGSNIILPNENVKTIFIKISNVLDFIEMHPDGSVDVGAGFSFQKLAKISSKKGFSGLEFAGGIPGSVGGAIYMNAGAHTKEVKDIVEEVVILDEDYNIKVLSKNDCNFSYRHSIFHDNNYIILSAKLQLSVQDKAEVFKKMLGNLEYRKEMQPLDMPTFGSVFKNPKGYHAGKLIEQSGLKGFQIGGAQVSKKHANFIVNVGGATATDVIKLIEHIKSEVKKKKNIELVTEVEIFKEE